MKFHQGFIPPGLLIGAALLLRFWIAPLATQLPADYVSEQKIRLEDRFRTSPALDWKISNLTSRRVDQTLANSGGRTIIQSDLHVYTDSGELIFESIGLYGVDRRTRQNLPGYGDIERTGQFLFPLHLAQTTYNYWDPLFIGLRIATFERAEARAGLPVYIFRFEAGRLDETRGYSYMPDVPERFQVHTDGQGMLWIEPVSGMVVDYEEQGVSYFVDPVTGARLEDFHQWNGRFTPETRAAQVVLARASRLRILALETWLPAFLLVLGIILLTVKAWQAARAKTAQGRQVGDPASLQGLKDEEEA